METAGERRQFETHQLELMTPEGTEELGYWFGARAWVGLLLDLRGELGTGKTCFVRGVARALQVKEEISSPTFNICHVYEGTTRLFHLDAYRLERPEEALIHGFDEMLLTGVVAVEWGAKLCGIFPEHRIEFRWQHVSASQRKVAISGFGPREAKLLGELPARFQQAIQSGNEEEQGTR